MAEADPSLSQRVESLERISHERVVEQVVDLGERVAGLESARATEEPHLATKADVARLETRIEHMQEQVGQLDEKIDARYDQLDEKIEQQSHQFQSKFDAQFHQFQSELDAQSHQFQSKLDAQSHQFQSKLDAQSHQFQSKLDAQSELLQKIIEQRINRMTAWLIGTGLAIAALILSRLPG
ncbi:MAG: hypothetical protein OXG84_01190 [Chloroflexi bacterium]|nr:hypothetical protein [Chloroflexota bacterium]